MTDNIFKHNEDFMTVALKAPRDIKGILQFKSYVGTF